MAKLYVIAGPSGSGKGTLIAEVLRAVPNLVVSVSATTRPKRPGEVDGREYFFLSEETFREWIDEGRFLEWAGYSGNAYGTPLAPVEKSLSEGQDVLLEIELKGAWQVLQERPDAVMIFIMPPSLEELEKRLRGRDTETEEAINLRLSRAREEVAEVEADRAPNGGRRFHYVIVNDMVQRASDELAQAILDAREVDEQANDR